MGDRRQITGPDGRRLDVELTGPDDGRALVFHNGTPGAGVVFAPLAQAGAERGLRHIAYSRPGYGQSDRRPGRTVADCVADVAAIADELGIERFFTVGWSGGGPHALACAALLPERTIAAATLASVAAAAGTGSELAGRVGCINSIGHGLGGDVVLVDEAAERPIEGTPTLRSSAFAANRRRPHARYEELRVSLRRRVPM
jgi:pimeloyl-ACP methyl ester carboxylesterase